MKTIVSKHDPICVTLCLALAAATSMTTAAADANTISAPAADAADAGILPVPDYTGSFWTRPRLTGDWGGARTDLANRGVQFDVDLTQYLQGITSGGRDRTTQYGGHLDY